MGQFFDRMTSYTTEELRGGARLVPVRNLSFYTVPSEIYAEFRVDLTLIDVSQITRIIEVIAETIEIVAQDHRVVGASYLQDTNKAGQLVDLLEVTVESTSGQSTDTFTQPLNKLSEAVFGYVMQRHVDQLDAIERL